MKITPPEVQAIKLQGKWSRRDIVKIVLVRKHNLQVNKEAVETETKQVTRPSAKDWLFLVEGFKSYRAVENLFLNNFVDDLGIKTEDPIIKSFTPEVAQAASIEKLVAALSILMMDYLDLIAEKQTEQLEKETLEVIFNQAIEEVARAFDVSPKRLRQEFNKLKWNNEHLLSGQILALSEKRRTLINESNTQSKARLVEILVKNAQPNLFVMTGIEHATIFVQDDDAFSKLETNENSQCKGRRIQA